MRQWLFTLVFVFSIPGLGRCLPIEAFDHAAEIRCKGERTCGRGLPSAKSIGGFLAIGLQGGTGSSSTATVKTTESGGKVAWISEGPNPGRMTLSWDSDSNPWQLSGGGLRCLDIRADGSTALTVEGVAFSGICDKGREDDCPPLVVEARIYDADDPTGQRYSTSVIRRHRRSSGRDLRIPYSSFSREGPNGLGRTACVGALTISFRADGLTNARVSFGKVFTNGACQGGDCVVQPPFSAPYFGVTATPTAVPMTPSPTTSPTQTPKGTASPAATALPTQRPEYSSPVKPAELSPTPTPPAGITAETDVVATPLAKEEVQAVPIEEALYGQVIVMQQKASRKPE